MLVDVRRCVSQDVEHGVRAVVGIYMGVLSALIRRQHLHVFVHPVPSVLDPCRPLARIFNRVLRERTLATAQELRSSASSTSGTRPQVTPAASTTSSPSSRPCNATTATATVAASSGALHFLDFFPSLLTPDQGESCWQDV